MWEWQNKKNKSAENPDRVGGVGGGGRRGCGGVVAAPMVGRLGHTCRLRGIPIPDKESAKQP